MNKLITLLTLIIAVAALYFALHKKDAETQAITLAAKEPVYENVLKTRTLRCAYASFKPLTAVDPNTGQLSGIMVDLLNDIAARLKLKLEWTEEVTWATTNAGFLTKRYDMFCTGMWPGALRATNTLFSNGMYFDPVGLFVKAGDTRFEGNPYKLNDPAYTVGYVEGDGTESMAKSIFPNAKGIPLGGISDGEYYGGLAAGKYDAVMATKLNGVQFSETNPNMIREVVSDKPIRVYPVTIALPEGEYSLKKMVDAVIFEQQDDGTVARIIKKHLPANSHMLYRRQEEYVPF